MKQVCVIGLGQFGTHMARTLVDLGCEVLTIDLRQDRVDALRDDVHRAIVGDARSPDLLASVLTQSVSEAIVAVGEKNLEPSILCTLNLARLEVPVIRATAINDDHAAILKAVGATSIIRPEAETAERTARHVANPNLRDLFSLSEHFRIMEVSAPAPMHGKSLAALSIRNKYDVLVLAIRSGDDEELKFLPSPDAVIAPDQVLLVLGRELDIVRLSQL